VSDLPVSAGFLLRRARARQRAREERARELRTQVRSAAERLVNELGAERVVLFGSVARGALHDRSDVDVAVAGLSPAQETAAWDLLASTVGAPVDLVVLESAPESLRRRIESDGEVLVSRT